MKASCLKLSTSDVQIQASNIVTELFCFPLAIDQTGAYIASGATTIGDCLDSEHQKTLLSHSEFTGASKYNRTVCDTWELSYKEIQERAKSDDSYKANAANSAMQLLELFPFFHHEGITEEIEAQGLEARKRILGVEHPDTILAMGNIASTYRDIGKYTEAEELEIQVLDAMKRIHEVEHPETVRAMANLGVTYRVLGKYTESEKLAIQVLDALKRILGVEHPDTVRAMANLGVTYRVLGKYRVREAGNPSS